MKLLKESYLEVKKSRFIGLLYDIESFDEIKKILNEVKSNNKKSTHICLAGVLQSEIIFKNDSEVGNPGRQLLQLLQLNKMENHLLIVVRYYGGIKLGVGGVQRAFRDCGKLCLSY